MFRSPNKYFKTSLIAFFVTCLFVSAVGLVSAPSLNLPETTYSTSKYLFNQDRSLLIRRWKHCLFVCLVDRFNGQIRSKEYWTCNIIGFFLYTDSPQPPWPIQKGFHQSLTNSNYLT